MAEKEKKKMLVIKGRAAAEYPLGNVLLLGSIIDEFIKQEPDTNGEYWVGTDGEDMSKRKDDVYVAQVYGKPALLYLWTKDDVRTGCVVAWGDHVSNRVADTARRAAMYGHIKLPELHLVQGDDAKYPWTYTYFHGAICKHVSLNAPNHRDRPDLVGSEDIHVGELDKLIPDGTGIFWVLVYGIRCTMYLWQVGGLRRGLIVSDVVQKDVDYAAKMYASRSDDI